MKHITKILALVIVGLALLSLFGWMSYHISKQDRDFGFLTEPIKKLYSFPDLFVESVEEAKTLGLPKTFMRTPEEFDPINNLEKDLFVLSAYSDTGNSRTVAVINLKNDSILHKWTFNEPILEYERTVHPLLLPGKGLVYSLNGKNLVRVDSASNVVWEQNTIWPHHSKELDSDGNIWLSTYPAIFQFTGEYRVNGRSFYFKDEFLTKVDAATGEILFQKSIADILRENGLSSYLLKSETPDDPIHTNDVEPALKTTEFYQQHDLFISTKQMSAIIHYRPSTNQVVNVIEGPFVGQHDVDFYGDSSLVFFNNNYHMSASSAEPSIQEPSKVADAGDIYSSIVRYDFATDSCSLLEADVFTQHRIFSRTEGLIDFYEPNTCFLEQQNAGVLWVIKENEVVYKNVLRSFHDGYHHLPNWTRIVKNWH
ncbi:MAG: hypothetical protein RL266_134 [Bacteroidota bacterium]|jgi:hypothetical protein